MKSDINQIKRSLLRKVRSNRNFAVMDIEPLKCGHYDSRTELLFFLVLINYNFHGSMWIVPPYWTAATQENKILLSQESQSISKIFTLVYPSSDFSGSARFRIVSANLSKDPH